MSLTQSYGMEEDVVWLCSALGPSLESLELHLLDDIYFKFTGASDPT